MTTYSKSAEIIEGVLKENRDDPAEWLARRILDTLREKRIVPHQLRASEEMFTRLHAHCRYLGDVTGQGYRYWYNKAIAYAVAVNNWPFQIITRTVKLDSGEEVTVDVPVPDSTTKATNKNLMEAYQVIEDEAKIRGIELPEGSHEQVRKTQL